MVDQLEEAFSARKFKVTKCLNGYQAATVLLAMEDAIGQQTEEKETERMEKSHHSLLATHTGFLSTISANQIDRSFLSEAVSDSSVPVSVIVTDVNMFVEPDVRLLDWVLSQPKLCHVPCIMTGCQIPAAAIDRFIRRGAVDFYEKPLNKALVLSSVFMILQTLHFQTTMQALAEEGTMAKEELARFDQRRPSRVQWGGGIPGGRPSSPLPRNSGPEPAKEPYECHVIFVDDDENNAQYVPVWLSSMQYNVTTFQSYEEAKLWLSRASAQAQLALALNKSNNQDSLLLSSKHSPRFLEPPVRTHSHRKNAPSNIIVPPGTTVRTPPISPMTRQPSLTLPGSQSVSSIAPDTKSESPAVVGHSRRTSASMTANALMGARQAADPKLEDKASPRLGDEDMQKKSTEYNRIVELLLLNSTKTELRCEDLLKDAADLPTIHRIHVAYIGDQSMGQREMGKFIKAGVRTCFSTPLCRDLFLSRIGILSEFAWSERSMNRLQERVEHYVKALDTVKKNKVLASQESTQEIPPFDS